VVGGSTVASSSVVGTLSSGSVGTCLGRVVGTLGSGGTSGVSVGGGGSMVGGGSVVGIVGIDVSG
jgi:hypothetical protein